MSFEKIISNNQERDSRLLREPRELEQINASPQAPGDEAGEVHAEDVRDAAPVADRRELANGGEAEGLFLMAGENRFDVLR